MSVEQFRGRSLLIVVEILIDGGDGTGGTADGGDGSVWRCGISDGERVG
jgi:hypothetical protein